jgi:3-oxoacyl-(acyl-carrier-protein) synthase
MSIRYSEPLTLLVQPGFRGLIDRAATNAGSKPTEWARAALRDALQRAGIDPANITTQNADDSPRDSNGEVAA